MRIFGYLAKKVGDLTVKYSNLPESYIKKSYEQVKQTLQTKTT